VKTRAPLEDCAVCNAELRVFAIGHNVLGVEFTVGHHLRQRHHGRRVTEVRRIRRDDVDIRILGRLRRGDAAI